MARENIQKLIKRYDKAVEVKELYRSVHEAAYEYALPTRNIFSNQTQGSSRMNKIFDSTGIRATFSFVNNMQKSITPPFQKWVNLKLGDGFKQFKGSEEYAKYAADLEHATERGFSILNTSNFNSITPMFYSDLAVGTGVMLTIPNPITDPVPMRFVVVPLEEIALEKGVSGSVGAKFRTHKMAVRLLKESWPDAIITVDIAKMLEEDPSQEICLIEAFYKRDGINYYDVIEKTKQARLVERRYNFDPCIVTRINPSPIDVYGSGPLVQATPDLRSLNKAKELTMRSAQLSIFGVYTVADNDIVNPNNIKLNPGTFIPVSRNSGPNGPSIAPLPTAGNFNAQNFFVQDLQASIKEMLLDSNLPPESGPVRSATEIMERISNIRTTTGVFFGPINQEFVQHLWTNILHILVDRNEIAIPRDLLVVDNFFIEVEVLSAIARSQDIEEMQGVVEAWQLYAQMVGPEQASVVFKMDKIGDYIAEKRGVTIDLIRTEDEQMQYKEEMAMAQQAQQMMLQQQEQA